MLKLLKIESQGKQAEYSGERLVLNQGFATDFVKQIRERCQEMQYETAKRTIAITQPTKLFFAQGTQVGKEEIDNAVMEHLKLQVTKIKMFEKTVAKLNRIAEELEI
jgi:hypothetical protein